MKKITLFFAFFSILCDLPAATWYVAPNGSDNKLGSLGSPLKTLPAAIEAASPGDVIELRNGSYASNEIRIGKSNLTIRSYRGEWAVITAPTNVEDIASCISYNEPEYASLIGYWKLKSGSTYAKKEDGTVIATASLNKGVFAHEFFADGKLMG